MSRYPGDEGSIGPSKNQYNNLHVYARDVSSGVGNCVCGRSSHDLIHPQLVPGMENPDFARRLRTFIEVEESKK